MRGRRGSTRTKRKRLLPRPLMAFGKFTWIELKLFLREPVGCFFTLLFPPLLLLLFGSIYGNEPTPMFGGRGTVDVSLPAYNALAQHLMRQP